MTVSGGNGMTHNPQGDPVSNTDIDQDTLVTCRNCSAELPTDEPCKLAEDGEHEPDMVIHEPPVDAPTRRIRVEATITVPNDGYDYRVDVGGRLERVLGRMLDDRLVTCVETSGACGSGWAEDVSTDKPPVPDGALPIGTYVHTKTHGHRGRITEAHGRCPEGPAWLMGQSVPLTGVYADGGGTWYSVLCHPAGAVVVTADDVEVVEPFQFDNPWADEHFRD